MLEMLHLLAVLKDTKILFVPFCFSLQVTEPEVHQPDSAQGSCRTLEPEIGQPALPSASQLKEHMMSYQFMTTPEPFSGWL